MLRSRRHVLGLAAALLMLAVLSACGSGKKITTPAGPTPSPMPSPSTSATFIYVTSKDKGTVDGATLASATGVPSNVPGSPFFAHFSPFGAAVNRAATNLFVANQDSGDISVFSINSSSGALAEIFGSPFVVQKGIGPIAVHPSGKFVYTVSIVPDNVFILTVASNGALSRVPGQLALEQGCSSNALGVEPSGAFLYVTCQARDLIHIFSIDQTSGALKEIGGSPIHELPISGTVGSGFPFDLIFPPGGGRMYVLDRAGNDINGFSINTSTGMLTPLPGSPYAVPPATIPGGGNIGSGPQSFDMTPDGNFIYTLNMGVVEIGMFQVNSNGSLTHIGDTANTSAPPGEVLRVTPDGKFVVSAGPQPPSSPRLWVYSINSTNGNLTPVTGSPFGGIVAGTVNLGMAVTGNTTHP